MEELIPCCFVGFDAIGTGLYPTGQFSVIHLWCVASILLQEKDHSPTAGSTYPGASIVRNLERHALP
jgi:hypothetical protein